MKPSAYDLSFAGDKYLGTPYSEMDCQAFVEACLRDVGIYMDLPGSNAWYREMTWTGSPEECKAKFGEIPRGAFLFILKHDGGEPDKYKPDGRGNASHIGIYTGRGKGAINSSYSRGCVCESEFHGVSISGGWNRVGLWDRLSYGEPVDTILEGGSFMKAIVTADQGGSVNLRAKPSLSAKVLVQVKLGEIVDVISEDGEWDEVMYNGTTGYMMSTFLEIVAGDPPDDLPPEDTEPQEPVEPGTVTITLDSDLAYALWMQLGDALGETGPDRKG